jgi:glycosyltransferase involved in cell wall biosynthesis
MRRYGLRVALLTEVFVKNMGYMENLLPKYLGRLGVDVHVVATDASPNHHVDTSEAKETYAGFVDRATLVPGFVERMPGFALHVLAQKKRLGYLKMKGLRRKLASLRPDIVQATHVIGWTPLEAAFDKFLFDYKLFTAAHYHESVFPLARKKLPPWSQQRLRCGITRTLPGWLVSQATEKCYAISPDCADVAARFFGVPRTKIEICPLGVDTELFHSVSNEIEARARVQLRGLQGFSESEIVCIYTGRFSEEKNPLLLAAAIAELVRLGKPFRGLFVGNGMQAQAIQSCAGCTIHAFVPVHELGNFYRASDIGVWPTQESMSMLDAAACGLPIVANQGMDAPERLEGNGLTYKLNDLRDLVRVLLELSDQQTRECLGTAGAQKMARDFSWESIARRRVQDYEYALGSRKPQGQPTISKERFPG